MMFEDGFLPLSPLNFFELGLPCHEVKKAGAIEENKYLLPSTEWLSGEDSPFIVHLGWSQDGIYFYCETDERFDEPNFPSLIQGDSIELFIDTRDMKTVGTLTKFCHHFYFLPAAVEGHQKGEITRFRGEDAHELADPADLELHVKKKGRTTRMHGFIPKKALFGFDPTQFTRLGFTYRINQRYSESIHFAVKTEEFNIEQDSALWASLNLIK